MKRINSKLSRVLGVTLLLAAAVTIGIAQDKSNLIDMDALAIRGETIANQDPLAVELRNLYPNGSWQRGVNIGMAVAEGHTLAGPGKDRACAALPPREPAGCSSAVSFSVERNRNAALAKKGAAIAVSDPDARRMRNATSDVFYKLGFDIGLAAAEGQTLPGPGKDRLRDSLLPALRGGFSAAITFTLERTRRDANLGATTGTTAGPAAKAASNEIRVGARPRPRRTSAGPAAKAASNEIRCRGFSRPGGGNYVFFTIKSRPSPTGETIVIYEMAFRTSWKAAGLRGEGLDPGQCAWADRPIGDGGPFRIRFETVANAQLKQQLKGSPVDRSTTAAETYPDVNTIPIYLKGDNRYWSFGGITNAGSYFVAIGHGYWKPPARDVNPSPTEPARPRGRVLFPPKP